MEQRTQRGAIQEGEPLSLRHIVAQIVARLDVPFGYTLTIWAAGHGAIEYYGLPSYGQILLFVGGASVGYLLIAYTIALRVPASGSETKKTSLALVDPVAMIGAVATVTMGNVISSAALGYFFIPMTATAVYAFLLGLLEYLALRIGLGSRQ